jgi:CPA1 family monovalent cation:H+ antiporter
MRGVIALAAALSLPEQLDDGAAFPQRDVLIFLTFCVILVTLVAQGLSLPFLIRKLGLAAKSEISEEERQARRQMLLAAINKIRELQSTEFSGEEEALVDLLKHYQQRLEETQMAFGTRAAEVVNYEQYRRLESHVRAVERSTILRMRDRNQINDNVLRVLERELDMLDARHLRTHP